MADEPDLERAIEFDDIRDFLFPIYDPELRRFLMSYFLFFLDAPKPVIHPLHESFFVRLLCILLELRLFFTDGFKLTVSII